MAHVPSHSHPHDHDHSTYYIEQLCTIGICGMLGLVCIMLWYQDILKYILHPKFHTSVFLGGITIVVLVVLRAVSLWMTIDQPGHPHHAHDHGHGHHHHHHHDHAHQDHEHEHGEHHDHPHHHDHGHGHLHHDHGHDHAHAHGHHHGHDHGWNPWRYIILLLPIVLYFLNLPNAAFSYDWVQKSSANLADLSNTTKGRMVENTGLRIDKESGQPELKVTSVAQGSGAAKAGIQVDDRILQIIRDTDGEGTKLDKLEVLQAKDLSLEDAVLKLKGKPQTKVKLVVVHADGKEAEVELVRAPDLIPLEFKELERAAYTAQSRKYYEGKIAQIKGQFMPGPNDRVFSLARIKITCCAADAIALNVAIMLDPNAPGDFKHVKPQQWVQVTGEIQFSKRKDRNEYASILVVASPKDVKETEPELNPYLQ